MMLDLMTLYTAQRKQYLRWSDQKYHILGTQQKWVPVLGTQIGT